MKHVTCFLCSYRVFPRIGGGFGLLSEYSVCSVGAPRVLGIEFVGRSKKNVFSLIISLNSVQCLYRFYCNIS
ncbi:hypothetical protein Hanom_Chr03g00261541 [Helianthus anomalus]